MLYGVFLKGSAYLTIQPAQPPSSLIRISALTALPGVFLKGQLHRPLFAVLPGGAAGVGERLSDMPPGFGFVEFLRFGFAIGESGWPPPGAISALEKFVRKSRARPGIRMIRPFLPLIAARHASILPSAVRISRSHASLARVIASGQRPGVENRLGDHREFSETCRVVFPEQEVQRRLRETLHSEFVNRIGSVADGVGGMRADAGENGVDPELIHFVPSRSVFRNQFPQEAVQLPGIFRQFRRQIEEVDSEFGLDGLFQVAERFLPGDFGDQGVDMRLNGFDIVEIQGGEPPAPRARAASMPALIQASAIAVWLPVSSRLNSLELSTSVPTGARRRIQM